jgi:putative transposase
MSWVRIWVHVVFTTQRREPNLTSDIRHSLVAHITENCRAKGIYLDSIGGWVDHLHLLISLGREQDIAKVIMLIKGESAHWLNQQKLLHGNFRWQDDYFAISVAESQLDRVRAYIARQEEHHKATPFDKELSTLRAIFGLKPE